MTEHNPLWKTTKAPRLPTDVEFLAMSDDEIAEFSCIRQGNWKKVPRERMNDAIISAVIKAHPTGITIIYSFQTEQRAQHVEDALIQWKSKTLQRLRPHDYPRNEAFVCELISADPQYYRHLPRELKTPNMTDAALAADITLIDETPSTLITEHHILMALDQDPQRLNSSIKTPGCPLSTATIERLMEEAPVFALKMQSQLSPEQIKRLANNEPAYWTSRRLPPVETLALIHNLMTHPQPGTGTRHMLLRLHDYQQKEPHKLYRDVLGSHEMAAMYALIALDIHTPETFGKHVRNMPKLMPYYQELYGSEAAMNLTRSPKLRRSILDRDLGM